MDYYIEDGVIEDGVRRAVAAREAKLQSILTILHESGKPPATILISLDRLHSPNSSLNRSSPRYIRAVQGMSSLQGRAGMPEIHVQPSGEPGQKSTIPLAHIMLDP
jgi:hypothetical protein